MKSTGNVIADTICRTAELGLTITGAGDVDSLTVIYAVPVTIYDCCLDCGELGWLRDHVTRRLIDLPIVGYPTRLEVRVPRFACINQDCDRVIFQTPLECVAPGVKVTKRVARWILQRLAIDWMSVAATAKALSVSWELVNTIAANATQALVYGDPHRLDGIRVLGVDEHKWIHTYRPGQPSDFVTVLVDLNPVVDGDGPARLIDMRPGRSAQVLTAWLSDLPPRVKDGIKVVILDGFTGYATAAECALPAARKVMDWTVPGIIEAERLDEGVCSHASEIHR